MSSVLDSPVAVVGVIGYSVVGEFLKSNISIEVTQEYILLLFSASILQQFNNVPVTLFGSLL